MRSDLVDAIARAMCAEDHTMEEAEAKHFEGPPYFARPPMGGFILTQERIEDSGRLWMTYRRYAKAALRVMGPAMSAAIATEVKS